MAQLNEIYPSYYNVLAYPPLILDDKSLYDQYTEWKKKIDKTWKQYDKDFLPKPLMDLGKSLAEAYKGDPDGYLHIANTAIRIAFLLIPGGQAAAFGVNLVLNKAIGIFYPPQNKSLFDQIKDAVSNLVDQKLIDQEISGVLIKLNSLQQPLSRFSNSIQRAVGKPQDFDNQTTSSNAIILDETQDCSKDDSCSCSNTQPRPSDAPLCTPCICRMKEVQQTFNNSSTDVNRALTDMKTTLKDVVGADQLRSYMQIYLPLYVTAATMELQMYKTYIDFTQKFDFDVTGTTKEHVNELRQKIKTHSEYIMGLFKKSLPEISNNTKEQLNAYIKYTRNITLNALDMVSTWKFLDPVDYPTTATFNPTRIIFNDLAGPVECLNSTQDSNKLHFNFFDMNGQSMPNNDIFNYFYRGMQVKGLQIQTYTSSDTKNPQHFPVGFLSSYYGSNGDFPFDKRVDPNKFTGGSKSVKLGDDVYESRSALSVINAVSNQLQVFLNYIDTEDLYFDQSVSPGGTACGSGNSTIWPDQKIQAIYPIQPDNSQTYPSYYSTSKIGFVTTLVPNDTTPWITFTDNGNNSIYTFSAENTRTLTGSAGPVREFITGSAPLGLSPGGGAQYSINTSDAPSGDYQVRVHVATPGSGGSLAISVDGKTQTLQLPDTNVNDTNHIAGFAGTYTLAPATQVDAATLKPKAPTENIFPVRQTSSLPVSITNNSSTVINIDRIEFVPVSAPAPDPSPDSGKPIHKSVPKTVTQLSTTKEIWSSTSEYATTISFTGNVYNDASITFQLLSSGQVVKEFPFTGNGVASKPGFHGSSPSCYDTPYPFSQPDLSVPKYNKLQVVMKSDGYSKPCDLGDSFPNTFDAEIDIKFNLSDTADLAQITAQVQGLFTSSSSTELSPNVSGYQIDQIALKVNALSDEVFCKEKIVLRKLVNKAKQFMKTRNLLIGGDFEILDKWALGTQATIKDNSSLFKGNHLFLQPTNGISSSYAYQKIDESKLKPYTRYNVSGFVAQSEHLEIVVSRYGKEIDKILNVPYEEALPVSSGNQSTCCKPSSCSCSACTGGPHPHFFSYSIDVGKLYPDLNPGIEFGLRLAHPSGYAKVGNLEIVEERPLTNTEIRKIQRKEEKWKKAWDTERAEINAILQPVINQINAFYTNGDWNGSILPHVTYQDLYNIVLPELSKLRHWFMKDRPGEHYTILQQFKQALERVFNQLEERNLIHNGSFTNGLANWLVDGDTQITTLENGNLALQLSDWDASASQSIDISDFDEDKEYTVRVYAKGKGTIRTVNCENEPLSFNTNTFTILEQRLYFDNPSVLLHIQSEGSEFVIGSVELIELSDDE